MKKTAKGKNRAHKSRKCKRGPSGCAGRGPRMDSIVTKTELNDSFYIVFNVLSILFILFIPAIVIFKLFMLMMQRFIGV